MSSRALAFVSALVLAASPAMAAGDAPAAPPASAAPAPTTSGPAAHGEAPSDPSSPARAAAAGRDAGAWTPAPGPVSPPWGVTRPTPPTPVRTYAGRMGARGVGLGIEPLVGMTYGRRDSNGSYGFSIGTALSLEVIPPLLVRGYFSYGRAYGAKAPISWVDETGRHRARQDASFWGLELGGGLAWLFRSDASPLVPFVGVDGAATFAGWRFSFPADDPRTIRTALPPVIRTRDTDPHEAIAWSWLATLRVGLRYTMLSWLASQADLGVSYWVPPRHSIGNTLTSLDVTSTGEAVWLVRATYSVRLGI